MLKTLTFLSLCCVVFCLKGSKTWEDFKTSPWIVNTSPDRNLDRRARFTGVNFMMSRDVAHDARQYRVYYDGVVGMETVMRRTEENDLYYRQVTDGKKFLKLVYAGRRGLVDCDVEKDKDDLDKFLSEFLLTDTKTITPMRRERTAIDVGGLIKKNAGPLAGNATYRLLEGRRVPSDPYATLADLQTLHGECIRLHHRIKHAMKARGIDVHMLQSVPSTDVIKEVSDKVIPRRVKRVKKSTQGRSRARRDLLMPDTKWCGSGSGTSNFDDVGESRETDRCCREHDHCPYYIEGFSSNYNYFNYYIHTVSHCYCDEMFRTCLRTAGTSKAEIVGELFFDILGMACFEFEMEQVCVERSFWGTCRTYEDQVVAKIRGSLDWD